MLDLDLFWALNHLNWLRSFPTFINFRCTCMDGCGTSSLWMDEYPPLLDWRWPMIILEMTMDLADVMESSSMLLLDAWIARIGWPDGPPSLADCKSGVDGPHDPAEHTWEGEADSSCSSLDSGDDLHLAFDAGLPLMWTSNLHSPSLYGLVSFRAAPMVDLALFWAFKRPDCLRSCPTSPEHLKIAN